MAINPDSRTRNLSYWDMTRERGRLLNSEAGKRIACILGDYKPLEEKLCVACAGSDGRLEKGFVSRFEVLLYHEDIAPEMLLELDRMVRGLKDEKFRPLVDDHHSETKDVRASFMSYAYQKKDLVFPSRVLDSFFMHGNEDLIRSAKARMIGEWTGPEGKRIHEHLRLRLKHARETMASGTQKWKGKEIVHADMAQGIARFEDVPDNGSTVQLRSFKPGPLRFVQIAVEQAVVGVSRVVGRQRKPEYAEALVRNLPTPTVEKLEYLSGHGAIRLGKAETADVMDCYLAFLQLYHMSEKGHWSGQKEVRFDPQEARERVAALQRLVGSGLVARG